MNRRVLHSACAALALSSCALPTAAEKAARLDAAAQRAVASTAPTPPNATVQGQISTDMLTPAMARVSPPVPVLRPAAVAPTDAVPHAGGHRSPGGPEGPGAAPGEAVGRSWRPPEPSRPVVAREACLAGLDPAAVAGITPAQAMMVADRIGACRIAAGWQPTVTARRCDRVAAMAWQAASEARATYVASGLPPRARAETVLVAQAGGDDLAQAMARRIAVEISASVGTVLAPPVHFAGRMDALCRVVAAVHGVAP